MNETKQAVDPRQELAAHVLQQSICSFEGIKKLGDKALAQLPDEGFGYAPEPESNSIAIIINHVSGNMISRWTDFLTSDGEKPGRNRDAEFEADTMDRTVIMERWEKGWRVLLAALESLQPSDLMATVYIRGEAHTALQAIHRQIAHYGYHIGQIVYAAKAFRSAEWQTLSIAKGQSAAFNASYSPKNAPNTSLPSGTPLSDNR
jgi:hypothetical protein